jgi:RNA polymerase sigma-70 factor (ECF subfamily)
MAAPAQPQELVALLAPVHDEARRLARRLCRSDHEGDDLFQEAVVRALEKLPALRDRELFRFWFFRILVTSHYSRARRSFWRRFTPLEHDDTARAVGDDGAAWAEQRFRAARVRTALTRLPAEQRAAVVMFELHGFTVEEIATIQGASVPAVKSRLSRGRDQLRRYYERIGVSAELAGVPAVARGGSES